MEWYPALLYQKSGYIIIYGVDEDITRTIQSSSRYNNAINRLNSKEIYKRHNRRIIKAIKEVFKFENIKLIIDSGDQGIGKTTHWIRQSINNNWITIVLTSTHYKAQEILKDLEISEDTARKSINPKLKYHIEFNTLRVHTIYGKFWELNKEDWYVSPQFEKIPYLCTLYDKNPKMFKLLKGGHLSKYCYKHKPKDVTSPKCIYRHDCNYNKQFNRIIEQIKGNQWQLLEKEIRKLKIKKNKIKIEKLKQLIEIEKEKRKKIHHLIILPHIYIFLETINKFFNMFKDEINSIVDESPLNLMFDPVTITYKRLLYELKFLDKEQEELEKNGIPLQIYDQFLPIINLLYNNIKYNETELKRIEEFKVEIKNYLDNNENNSAEIIRQDLEKYRSTRDKIRAELILQDLKHIANNFNEEEYKKNYNNYMKGIIKFNESRLDPIQIPNNLFTKIYDILLEIKKINDFNILKNRLGIYLDDKFLEFFIDKREFIFNLIESCKDFIIFTDATAEKNTSQIILNNIPFIFLPRQNISNYKIYGYPINGKLNAKYQTWDPEEDFFTDDGIKLIKDTAWLIKENKTKKLMIALFGEFNDWKQEEEKFSGRFMIILGKFLQSFYNINIQDLDIKLGFWYAESGKDRFKDRELQIQFGCPGIPSRATKIKSKNFGLKKEQIDNISIFKEQEQMAGRTRSFLHYIPIQLYFLTNKISPYFTEQNQINNIYLVLKYKDLIDYMHNHNPVTTRQIHRDVFPDRSHNNIRIILHKLERAGIGLTHRLDLSYVWFFRN